MTYFETAFAPLENWNQTQDNDQDDIVDIDMDETENEFDSHATDNALPPVSSHGEMVKGSVQLQKPPLPVMPPIWAQVRAYNLRVHECPHLAFSLAKKSVSQLIISEATRVESISRRTLSKAIFWAGHPQGPSTSFI